MATAAQPTNRFDGQKQILMPGQQIRALSLQQRLLSGLMAVGAGYYYKSTALLHFPKSAPLALVYCTRGQGWCEIDRCTQPLRAGELAVLAPGLPRACGSSEKGPWTLHWAQAEGEWAREWVSQLRFSSGQSKLWVGDNLQIVLLFNEMFTSLAKGFSFPNVLRASTALAHMLALCVAEPEPRPDHVGGLEKIGHCIEFMSEHLHEPIKVAQLAAIAGLSPTHFGVVFKDQTGSSPREYLNLLRMHQACTWLRQTPMPLKVIADRLGYQDQFHFSRRFKCFTGLSPSHYRERPSGKRSSQLR